MTIDPQILSFLEEEISNAGIHGITVKNLYNCFDYDGMKVEVAKALNRLVALNTVYKINDRYYIERRAEHRGFVSELRYGADVVKSKIKEIIKPGIRIIVGRQYQSRVLRLDKLA